ncbi:diguanylate cyclase/phosphodiesterase with PAS/PAC sensor(s) [Rhodobacter aestuarii]|uniref:Diguanylate cyclase/phosphodiesterase with PAS/PAC sensor(S) n=1 Tax=Rhodobacter aestuarii TaxID=453582 RepID=A0A1N7KEJ6_9RHOB|nr:EAL domain-containing protein [Rhodobacter aestuarii]PTV95730.1 diguanylate cyclase/phosphodiesterase with PAS/PAC sensor(s) [Rhodobacter aestuarii]SIS60002.1 diguanylate cyclase/phosphodiesterase with PAS/PAC sensor(s) [Rhodobacter aestuarii]
MALWLSVAYAVMGVLYVLTSDWILGRIVPDLTKYQMFQTVKGWTFIALTALGLWVILRHVLGRLETSLADANLAESRLRGALIAAGGSIWRTEKKPDGGLNVFARGSLMRGVNAATRVTYDDVHLRSRIHPEDRPIYDAFSSAISHGDAELPTVIWRVRTDGGEWRWAKIVPDLESLDRNAPGSVYGVSLDITDLNQTTQALTDVIAGAELGTWRHDLRSGSLQVNARWAEMLGYTLEELNPQVIDDWRALVHPDDMAHLAPIHAWQFENQEHYFGFEFRMRHKNGHWVWIVSRGRAVEIDDKGNAQILSGVHIDVSRRKALEAELREQSDFLQRLTETSVSGILALDEAGVVVFANFEAQQILDTTGAGLVGRRQDEIGWMQRGAGPSGAGVPLGRLRKERAVLRDLRLTLPLSDGTEREISVNAAPMESPDGRLQVVCSVSDITQRLIDERLLAQAAEEARFAARHDALTGLPNRELFGAHAESMVRQARTDGRLVAQVFLCVDQFQQVKDRFGPLLGDRLICQIAERLDGLRDGAKVLARVGAAEFTFLDRLDSMEEAARLTASIAVAFETPFELDGQTIYLNSSMGVSLYPMDAMSAEEMWINADLAMYEAKALGGNQCVAFTAKLRDRMAREALIGQSLQRAIRERAFELVLQPKVNLQSGNTLAGAEVLIRCTDPDLAGIGPAEFMPVAEKTGLIRQIDLLVIDLAGLFMADLHGRGLSLHLSINLSPESLRQAGFGAEVLAHMAAAGLGSEDVQFELTEGAVVDLKSDARGAIALLLEAGFELSADDFGTGYSSMSYLQSLNLKELKIDQSFVSRLGLDDGAADAIVLATLAMAQALGLRSVAEGIDTPAQEEWLRAHGCDVGQGYHFGRPMPLEKFVETYLATPKLREAAVAR